MRTSARLSRGFALASSGALIAGLSLVGAPASAAIPSQFETEGSSSADSSCTVTSGSDSVINGPKVLHQGRAKGSVNLNTTWTGANPSDVTNVSGHSSGAAHVIAPHDVFKSSTLTTSSTVTVSRALGSSSVCDVNATLGTIVEYLGKQTKPGWVYATRSSSKGSVAEIVVADEITSQPVVLEIYQGGSSTVTLRGFAKPGTYIHELVAGVQAGDVQILIPRNGGSISRASLKNTISESFHAAGSAFSKAKGSATSFVKFPGSISCSGHKATLQFKSNASKVAAGDFFVNGKKLASVSNPKGGHHVVLKHLSSTADNTVSVNLSLKAGGKASASDLYVPCKG